MRIAIGSDHRGHHVKAKLLQELERLGHNVIVEGDDSPSIDYPDVAFAVGRRVSDGEVDRGILICGSGIGMAIAANKFKGVRAAAVYDEMLAEVPEAFREREFREVSRHHDQVVVLREEILHYLQQVGRQNLTNIESDELAQLVSATSEIESISAAIGRELAPVADVFREEDITASDVTGTLLEKLYEATRAAALSGLRAIVEKDERAAQDVVARRDELWTLGNELLQRQAARLAQDDPRRLLKHRVQVDLLDKMRRIYGVAERMAIAVLPRGVLAGELAA